MYKEHDHNPLFCDICGFKANGGKRMYDHKKSAHSEKIKCQYCDKVMSFNGFQWHVRQNHEDKLLQCSKCGMRFLEQQNLDDHMNWHLLLRPHKCQFCPRAFHKLIDKEKHLRICLKNISNTSE